MVYSRGRAWQEAEVAPVVFVHSGRRYKCVAQESQDLHRSETVRIFLRASEMTSKESRSFVSQEGWLAKSFSEKRCLIPILRIILFMDSGLWRGRKRL